MKIWNYESKKTKEKLEKTYKNFWKKNVDEKKKILIKIKIRSKCQKNDNETIFTVYDAEVTYVLYIYNFNFVNQIYFLLSTLGN